MFVEVLYMELHTFSFELSTTLCVCGIRTTWWSNCRVGSHTRAGKFRFNIANSAIKREPEKYTHIYISTQTYHQTSGFNSPPLLSHNKQWG